jgi:Outer membrane protein beta-barrel domain
MKKIILSAALVALCSVLSFAQGISGGVRAGVNLANIKSSGSGVSITSDTKVGLLLGGYLKIMISEKFGIQPELVYSQLGGSTSFSGFGQTTTTTSNLNYLSVPIMARYNITENFNLQAGPQLAFLLSASDKSGSAAAVDIKEQLNSLDLGLAFGLGVDFGKFNAGARYALGLSNLVKNVQAGSDGKSTNNTIQLFVGYQLFGK